MAARVTARGPVIPFLLGCLFTYAIMSNTAPAEGLRVSRPALKGETHIVEATAAARQHDAKLPPNTEATGVVDGGTGAGDAPEGG